MAIVEGRVLVTGAAGFIGKRLVKSLLAEGYSVRALVRRPETSLPAGAERVVGDLLEPATLDVAFAGVDTAYYLVHSMAGGRAGFERRERQAAEYFTFAASRAGVRRVIYLGGLGETGDNLSEHLKSRREVAEILNISPRTADAWWAYARAWLQRDRHLRAGLEQHQGKLVFPAQVSDRQAGSFLGAL